MANRSGRPRKNLGDLCDNGHALTSDSALKTRTGWRCGICKRAHDLMSYYRRKSRAEDDIEIAGFDAWIAAGGPYRR